mgnify:CR=1 FL=1
MDRKDGHRLFKDTTTDNGKTSLADSYVSMEPNTTLELIREPWPIITAQMQWGKGIFIAESEVLKYPDIPDTTHEFGALLQFGTIYELMEFFATHQIKVPQRMVEEHVEQQMIKRALTRTAESEDEGSLARVGRQRNVRIRRMGIELPPLNVALVEGQYQRQRHGDQKQKMFGRRLNRPKLNYKRPTNASRSCSAMQLHHNGNLDEQPTMPSHNP